MTKESPCIPSAFDPFSVVIFSKYISTTRLFFDILFVLKSKPCDKTSTVLNMLLFSRSINNYANNNNVHIGSELFFERYRMNKKLKKRNNNIIV